MLQFLRSVLVLVLWRESLSTPTFSASCVSSSHILLRKFSRMKLLCIVSSIRLEQRPMGFLGHVEKIYLFGCLQCLSSMSVVDCFVGWGITLPLLITNSHKTVVTAAFCEVLALYHKGKSELGNHLHLLFSYFLWQTIFLKDKCVFQSV